MLLWCAISAHKSHKIIHCHFDALCFNTTLYIFCAIAVICSESRHISHTAKHRNTIYGWVNVCSIAPRTANPAHSVAWFHFSSDLMVFRQPSDSQPIGIVYRIENAVGFMVQIDDMGWQSEQRPRHHQASGHSRVTTTDNDDDDDDANKTWNNCPNNQSGPAGVRDRACIRTENPFTGRDSDGLIYIYMLYTIHYVCESIMAAVESEMFAHINFAVCCPNQPGYSWKNVQIQIPFIALLQGNMQI